MQAAGSWKCFKSSGKKWRWAILWQQANMFFTVV